MSVESRNHTGRPSDRAAASRADRGSHASGAASPDAPRRRALPLAVALAVLGLALAPIVASPPAGARDVWNFTSADLAYEQGRNAHRSGNYTVAEPALRYAAERGSLMAKHDLAQLYADPASTFTDHEKALALYNEIIDRHAGIDIDDPRARYVGKAMTAVGRYLLRGNMERARLPNPAAAARLFEEAANFFRDQDAELEIAKLYLTGEGVEINVRQATSRLWTLSKSGHAGAQAVLAELLWNGKLVRRDEAQALLLITIAVENAPATDRIWIEDTYHRIFCGASAGVRQHAESQVASFRHRLAPRPGTEPQDTVGLEARPVRSCNDGTPLPATPGREGRLEATPATRGLAGQPPAALQGGMLGINTPANPQGRR